MQRRRFLAASLASMTAAAVMPTTGWAIADNNPYRKNIGIQLYTLRDAIKEDASMALKMVAAAGYQQVEAYGFPDCEKIIQAAQDAGLPMKSSHFNSDPVVSQDDVGGKAFEKTLQRANDLGLSHLVIPYLGDKYRTSLDDYKKLAGRCNRAAEKAKTAGIQLAYHNHAFEFEPMGQRANGENSKSGYDILMAEFSGDMKFEVDVFWVKVAGKDPVALLENLSGRVSQLHLKDLSKSVQTPVFGGIDKSAFEEIGDGVVDIDTIMAKAGDLGIENCHVEQDHSPHPVRSILQSIAYMKTM